MAWVIATMLITFLIEVPALVRNKMYRELLSFSILWVLAFIYASLVALKVPLPTVVDVLENLYGVINL